MRKIIYLCIVFAILVGTYVFYLPRDRASGPIVGPQAVATIRPNVTAESYSGLRGKHDSISPDDQLITVATNGVPKKSIAPRVPDQAILWGAIQTETGETVTGEALKLYSASLNRQYVTVSNNHGEFVIDEVTPANEYQISVSPRGMYQRYEVDIEVGANQTDIKIVLRDLRIGPLAGRIVDVRGNPVPGFNLSVRNLSKPRWSTTATGDENGQFEVDRVPQGVLEISSTLNQLLKITETPRIGTPVCANHAAHVCCKSCACKSSIPALRQALSKLVFTFRIREPS